MKFTIEKRKYMLKEVSFPVWNSFQEVFFVHFFICPKLILLSESVTFHFQPNLHQPDQQRHPGPPKPLTKKLAGGNLPFDPPIHVTSSPSRNVKVLNDYYL